jgi:hypothetical protein
VPNVERLIEQLRHEFSRPSAGAEVPQATAAVLGVDRARGGSRNQVHDVEAHTHVVPKAALSESLTMDFGDELGLLTRRPRPCSRPGRGLPHPALSNPHDDAPRVALDLGAPG